jgi:dipeptidyl aminopeptidase/acylaminoacyl peptidase
VRVDLAAGTEAVSDGAGFRSPTADYRHPRVSPDGQIVAALLHREGRWRLVLVSQRGETREIATPGFPVGPPAWSADGPRIFVATDASGIWNIVSLDASAATGSASLTRVTGGAFSPAPSPDGKSLFFLDLTAAPTAPPAAPGDRCRDIRAWTCGNRLDPAAAPARGPPASPRWASLAALVRLGTTCASGFDGAGWEPYQLESRAWNVGRLR